MASNYTEHYGLCQWEATDQVRREEFNQDNAKMDEILKTLADKDITLERAVAAVAAAAGNCQMELITYTGTGTYGTGKATKITFSQIPDVYFIVGDLALVTGLGGNKTPLMVAQDKTYNESFVDDTNVTWNDAQLSLVNSVDARYQMNSKSKQYWALGLKRNIV